MAEDLLVQTLSEAGMQAIQIRSAGLNALVGHQADKIAIRLMLEQGVDVSAQRGQQLNRDLLRWADLVLVMDKAQKLSVESWDPGARGKVYRIGEWSDFDVPDPYQQSENEFVGAFGYRGA